eukprot:4063479-Pyramimonas_sp.AAC.1
MEALGGPRGGIRDVERGVERIHRQVDRHVAAAGHHVGERRGHVRLGGGRVVSVRKSSCANNGKDALNTPGTLAS